MTESEISSPGPPSSGPASFSGVSRRRETLLSLSARPPKQLPAGFPELPAPASARSADLPGAPPLATLRGGGRWLLRFGDWPAGRSPREIGKRVAENFAARALNREGHGQVHYAEACAFYGAASVARQLRDAELGKRLCRKFQPLLGPSVALVPSRPHVDDRVFGIAPLELYLLSGDERCRALGLRLADAQWQSVSADDITSEARYWVDDLYMIPSLQMQAYRVTRDEKYLDRGARTMVAYLERIQLPNGLFFHTQASPILWGRGNGWAAAGMTEVLRELPQAHPLHARILAGYRRMLATLLEHQDEQGVWHQIVDSKGAWPELSATAMFTFALAEGVRSGWLPLEKYGLAARHAWLGLSEYLDNSADLANVCVGTGAAIQRAGAGHAAQMQYYLDRPRSTGDLHGQAPLLWTASALLHQ
jgi:rhamnogalacturonyl hydrolase YesR